MSKDEALKLALDALDEFCELGAIIRPLEVRDALQKALTEQPAYRAVKTFHEGKPVYVAEQPAQQEPVGWWDDKLGFFAEKHFDQLRPLYTSPPAQRTWVGLTIEEIASCCIESTTTQLSFAQELEAKLKEKNCD